jgi:GNAT superfamily N-acetyltransferase
MGIHIRKAQPGDAMGIAAVLRGLEWITRFDAEPIEATAQRVAHHLELCHADDSHTVYVAENEDGEIAGYAAVHWLPYLLLLGPEGYVSELFIREADRGQGIGTWLMEIVKKEAKARGCARLMLLNMQERESYRRAFYKKQGWEERPDAANFVYRLL